MALTAEEHEAIMECDEYVAASDAAGGKRPAESATARKPRGHKAKKLGWLTVSCPANKQGQLTFADVEDAISILLLDLTDESREGGAIEGIVPTSPRLVDDSIPAGPWFFGFENQWTAMRIAEAADVRASSLLIQRTARSSVI
ncbi:hypothetical protein AB1Y20_019065 [Prymnesium parvum]|uniref:Uncharacterized protein n=1 Tax=Prymnesium parvum TaxID=97485 RepID=A0AB34JT63_PRYPA